MTRTVAQLPPPLAGRADLGALPPECAGLLSIALAECYCHLAAALDPAGGSRRQRDKRARLAMHELDALHARLRAIRDSPPHTAIIGPAIES